MSGAKVAVGRQPEIRGSRENRREGRAWTRPAEGPGVQTEQCVLGWLPRELRSPRGFWSMRKPWGRRAGWCVGLALHRQWEMVETDRSASKSRLNLIPAMLPWPSDFIFLCLHFLNYKMGLKTHTC